MEKIPKATNQTSRCSSHTVTWPDGLAVTRVAHHRGAMYLEVRWRGGKHQVRILKTRAEVAGG